MKKLLTLCLLSIATNCFADFPNYYWVTCPIKIECFGTMESCVVRSHDDLGYFVPAPKAVHDLPPNGVYTLSFVISNVETWIATCDYSQPSTNSKIDTDIEFNSIIPLMNYGQFHQDPYHPSNQWICKNTGCPLVRCAKSGTTCKIIDK